MSCFILNFFCSFLSYMHNESVRGSRLNPGRQISLLDSAKSLFIRQLNTPPPNGDGPERTVIEDIRCQNHPQSYKMFFQPQTVGLKTYMDIWMIKHMLCSSVCADLIYASLFSGRQLSPPKPISGTVSLCRLYRRQLLHIVLLEEALLSERNMLKM